MMMGSSSSRPKSCIRRSSSMRGLEGDDSSVQPPPSIFIHQHQNYFNSPISEDHTVSDHYNSSFLASIILPGGNNPRRGNSGGGFDQSSYLRTCGLCRRWLGAGRDLYMYKGDAAFCSEECRAEQMKRDEPNTEEK